MKSIEENPYINKEITLEDYKRNFKVIGNKIICSDMENLYTYIHIYLIHQKNDNN
jgi:hypothetical protein